jgi:hypothetical protein
MSQWIFFNSKMKQSIIFFGSQLGMNDGKKTRILNLMTAAFRKAKFGDGLACQVAGIVLFFFEDFAFFFN